MKRPLTWTRGKRPEIVKPINHADGNGHICFIGDVLRAVKNEREDEMTEKRQGEKRIRIFVPEGAELVFPPSNGSTKDFPVSIGDRTGRTFSKKPYRNRVTKDNGLQTIVQP